MQRQSIWENNANDKKSKGKKLQGNINTDILIIGGGIAGILCANRLKNAGVDCILVEKEGVLQGVTCNTTAKITAQHGLIYDKLQKMYGMEKAQQYFHINKKALKEYWRMAEKIPCDIESKTAYVYTLQNRKKLEKEAEIYEQLHIPYIWQEHTPLPMKVCGVLGMKGQAQFNPLKLLENLTTDLIVYENTEVLDIQNKKAYTDHGIIEAEQIVLATHFPMINIPGGYFVKMYQNRSYALALEEGEQVNGMYIDEKKDGLSFRNYKNYLILGGGGHKTGTKGGGFQKLEQFASQKYPNKKISFVWATQDCMSLDGIPYIGYHSRSRKNVLVATGFNKWGMTGAMSSAIVLEQLITKGKSEYEELFSPKRSMLHPQILINLGSAIGNIVRPGKRCTHMGCALRWNTQERTWDCPYHGSKFAENGKVLENPAKRSL